MGVARLVLLGASLALCAVAQSDKVYINASPLMQDGRPMYHARADCPTLRRSDVIRLTRVSEVSRETAEKQGRVADRVCFGAER